MDISVKVKHERVSAESVGTFNLVPQQLWTLLACTESRPVFRVENRKQLSCQDGRIVEQVMFLAPVRILFWRKWAFTEVVQTVDMSDPNSVQVTFSLIRSDMMSHLSGTWHFQLLEAPHGDSLGKTRVTYCFEMWPKGVPTALRFMPGLLDAVKSAVAREAAQLMDKLAFVADKVTPGKSLQAAAAEASAEIVAAGGSYKCLQLQRSGNAAEAAAAAAAEATARQQLKQQQQQQPVMCHALDDVSSEEEDCLVALDSASSTSSTNWGLAAEGSCESLASGPQSGSVRSCSSSLGGASADTPVAASAPATPAAMLAQ